ncbi:MAG: T9SS type A sorting domain-containing protein [Bacteroidales bacterium]|nr:T9SS type A sorting domain-containing protein [Bacteroidales bacterium]
MKKTLFLVLAVTILLVLKQNAHAQAGQLDVSFGEDGIVMYDLSGDLHETIWDIAILEDATSLSCGTINVGDWGTTDGFLLKLADNGSVVESWGNNGMVTFDLGEDTYAYKVEILPDNKILVCGTAYVTASNSEFFVAKFNPDGSPDVDFGMNGSFISAHANNNDEGYCMAIQNDGKIVMGGTTGYGTGAQMMFVRINPDGTIDDTFGMNGYSTVNSSTQSENIKGIDVMSNGNIVGAGYSYQSDPVWVEIAAMVMLHENGSPVTEFGNNGILIPDWVDSFSYMNDVEVKDDFIYITGWIQEVDNDIFLAKLDANGIFDPSFATDGLALFNLNIIDNAFDLYFGSDQKIYLCGNTGSPGVGGSKEFLLLRYLPDGNIDTSLNSTGHVETEIRVDSDAAFSVKLQADGKIVLAGMSSGLTTTQGNNIALVRYLNDFTPLYAGFSASDTIICQEEYVMFTDQSTTNAVSWDWYFEGGNPETSDEQNPTIYYEIAGVFDVRLVISDGTNSDTLLMEDFMTVNDCTGIDENMQQQVRIFPNPAKNVISIEFETATDNTVNVSIFHAQGRIVMEETITQGNSVLNVSNLQKGIYIVRLSAPSLNETVKLVIE